MTDYYLKYSNKTKEKVRSLRRNMTKEEKHIWYDFLKTYPIKVYRQRAIDNYIVDFYCSDALLIIEIDGSQHYSDAGLNYDSIRTEILERYNLKVLRFTNHEINFEFDNVCCTIDEAIKSRIKELR